MLPFEVKGAGIIPSPPCMLFSLAGDAAGQLRTDEANAVEDIEREARTMELFPVAEAHGDLGDRIGGDELVVHRLRELHVHQRA
jgi:hypothetical protein